MSSHPESGVEASTGSAPAGSGWSSGTSTTLTWTFHDFARGLVEALAPSGFLLLSHGLDDGALDHPGGSPHPPGRRIGVDDGNEDALACLLGRLNLPVVLEGAAGLVVDHGRVGELWLRGADGKGMAHAHQIAAGQGARGGIRQRLLGLGGALLLGLDDAAPHEIRQRIEVLGQLLGVDASLHRLAGLSWRGR